MAWKEVVEADAKNLDDKKEDASVAVTGEG